MRQKPASTFDHLDAKLPTLLSLLQLFLSHKEPAQFSRHWRRRAGSLTRAAPRPPYFCLPQDNGRA